MMEMPVTGAQQVAQRCTVLRLGIVVRRYARGGGGVCSRGDGQRCGSGDRRIDRIGARGPGPPDEQHHGDDDQRQNAKEYVKAAAGAFVASPGGVATGRRAAGRPRAGRPVSRGPGAGRPCAARRAASRRGRYRSLRRPTICHEIHLLNHQGLHIRYHYTHLIPGNQLDLLGIRATNGAMRRKNRDKTVIFPPPKAPG